MTTIISISKNANGFHDVEARSNDYIPAGFIFVPPEVVGKLNRGWCDLIIDQDETDGGAVNVLTDAAPADIPEGWGVDIEEGEDV
jgi:hypothetical protein